jgi:hypothetical protein
MRRRAAPPFFKGGSLEGVPVALTERCVTADASIGCEDLTDLLKQQQLNFGEALLERLRPHGLGSYVQYEHRSAAQSPSG